MMLEETIEVDGGTASLPKQFYENLKELHKDEQLDEMKARAGHQLVHEVKSRCGDTVKLLYLTNKQASAVANDETSVKILLEKLCGDMKRDLVIDLVHSWGFKKSTLLFDKESFNNEYSKFCAGVQHNISPFGNKHEDELLSLGRLDDFMERIIIPLAMTTKATIICHAVSDYCVLTDSFLRTYRQLSSKWNDNPPFAIIGAIGSVEFFYFNDVDNSKEERVWVQMMKSKPGEIKGRWGDRHNKFLKDLFDYYKKHGRVNMRFNHDLNWSTKNILIVEGLDTELLEKKPTNVTTIEEARNWNPFLNLKSAIISHYSKDVPSIAIKTATARESNQSFERCERQTNSLLMLLELLNMKTKVICLDMRKRKVPEGRASIMQLLGGYNDSENNEKDINFESIKCCIKRELQNFSDEGEVESLDCCLISYLHYLTKLYCRINDPMMKEHADRDILDHLGDEGCLVHKIHLLEKENHNDDTSHDFLRISEMFAVEYYKHLAKFAKESKLKFYEAGLKDNFYENGEEKTQRVSIPEEAEVFHIFRDEIDATTSVLKKLLESPSFYSVNIMNFVQRDLVYDIVRGTTPPETLLPCLRLLRGAWIEVCYTDFAALRYKRISKVMFTMQLLISFYVTIFSVVMETWKNEHPILTSALQDGAFISSLLLSAVVAFDTILAPRSKWRHLRVACVSLESLIWRFRMRAGEFEEDLTTHESQEDRLRKAIDKWRRQFMMGSNGPSLTFFRGRKTSVARHTCPKIFEVDKVRSSDAVAQKHNSNHGFKIGDGPTYREVQVDGNETIDVEIGGSDLTEVENEQVDCESDDHFSSLSGKQYVKLRIESLIDLYHNKFSRSEVINYVPEITVIFLGVLIALFSKMHLGIWVTILVAFLSNYNSWIEFRGRKERQGLLSNAIDELRIKRLKWRGQNKFRTLSKEARNEVVLETENLVMQVVSSWSTSMVHLSSVPPSSQMQRGLNQGPGEDTTLQASRT